MRHGTRRSTRMTPRASSKSANASCRPVLLPLPQWVCPTIFKLTCWLCGAIGRTQLATLLASNTSASVLSLPVVRPRKHPENNGSNLDYMLASSKRCDLATFRLQMIIQELPAHPGYTHLSHHDFRKANRRTPTVDEDDTSSPQQVQESVMPASGARLHLLPIQHLQNLK